MRDSRLICSDFFVESFEGFRTKEDVRSYDLIVGNAPWGEKLLTEAARAWASNEDHTWPLANMGIGTLFLPKAAQLLKTGGRAAIIQSASSLLFNRQNRAVAFREKLFSAHRIEEIINLSALRFKVFKRKTHTVKTSISPACVIVFGSDPPGPDDRISYISPKQSDPLVDEFQIVIEQRDRRSLTLHEAITDASAWTSLMWGSNRDRALLRRLKGYASLAAPGSDYQISSREGIIFGNREKSQPQLRDRRILKDKNFPSGPLYLDAETLPKLDSVKTDSRASTDFSAFAYPQLIIKQGWQKEASRFQARLSQSAVHEGVLCTQSYITVHARPSQSLLLDAACLSLNSMFATYFLFLTSGRFATYRPEPLVEELLAVPLPPPKKGLLDGLSNQDEIDERAMAAFDLKDAERVLVEDLFHYTLPDFQGDHRSAGRQCTARNECEIVEPQLFSYCAYFIRVLKAVLVEISLFEPLYFKSRKAREVCPIAS